MRNPCFWAASFAEGFREMQWLFARPEGALIHDGRFLSGETVSLHHTPEHGFGNDTQYLCYSHIPLFMRLSKRIVSQCDFCAWIDRHLIQSGVPSLDGVTTRSIRNRTLSAYPGRAAGARKTLQNQ